MVREDRMPDNGLSKEMQIISDLDQYGDIAYSINPKSERYHIFANGKVSWLKIFIANMKLRRIWKDNRRINRRNTRAV